MGNTASDRKKEMYISQHNNRRESLTSAPGTPPATGRHKQPLVIQQSAEDSDSVLNLEESSPGSALPEGLDMSSRQALRPRATTISHAPEHHKGDTHLPTVFRYKGQAKQVCMIDQSSTCTTNQSIRCKFQFINEFIFLLICTTLGK
jgi:hypothetical protein